MKSLFRKLLGAVARLFARHYVEAARQAPLSDRDLALAQVSQANFKMLARLQYERTGKIEDLNEIGFTCYSQCFEDGQLLYIFSLIGTTRKTLVEMCASDGIECLGANLVINQGWRALFVDGDAVSIERGRKYYASLASTKLQPPTYDHQWITRDNVNSILRNNDFAGEIDLLILDLDGNDYHIWESIDAVNPRVVVVEYNSVWPASGAAKVMPYNAEHSLEFDPDYYLHYCGASLEAFQILGRRKGYRLIGLESKYSFNAYFMRNDVGAQIFPEIDPVELVNRNPHKLAHTERFRTNPDPAFQKRLSAVQSQQWLDISSDNH